eukprot:6447255-Alexandrium_andersonii.AAC.1
MAVVAEMRKAMESIDLSGLDAEAEALGGTLAKAHDLRSTLVAVLDECPQSDAAIAEFKPSEELATKASQTVKGCLERLAAASACPCPDFQSLSALLEIYFEGRAKCDAVATEEMAAQVLSDLSKMKDVLKQLSSEV